MGFIEKFILPKQVDFDHALQAQADAARDIVSDMQQTYVNQDEQARMRLALDAGKTRELKNKNMVELLDVFITSYDKESIYRIIVQLDWIGLSVNHFCTEADAYGIESLAEYALIFSTLREMSEMLSRGVQLLSRHKLHTISREISDIHDQYDVMVGLCAQAMAELFKGDDCKHIIMYRGLLWQLKEVGKRIHIAANTLEDMAIKRV